MTEPAKPAPLRLILPNGDAPRPLFEQLVTDALRELCAASNRTSEDVHMLLDVSTKMSTEILAIGSDVRKHNVVLARYLGEPLPMPGERRESPSSHDLARFVSQDVIAQVRAYEANPSTPPGPPNEKTLAGIIEERVAARLAIREAQRLQKSVDERAEKDRKDQDAERKIRVQKWITLLAVIAGGSAWLVEHFLGH